MRQVSAAVPALAWALSEATMTDFMVVAWAKVLKMPREMFSSPACLARQMLTTLLDGRADAAEYLAKFDSRGVKSTKRVAQATEDRSRAALQNVDADNIEVMFKNMERTCRPGPFDPDREWHPRFAPGLSGARRPRPAHCTSARHRRVDVLILPLCWQGRGGG